MKILVGVDDETDDGKTTSAGVWTPVIHLLRRLQFPAASYDAVHVMAPYGAAADGLERLLVPEADLRRVYQEERDAAEQLIEEAAHQLQQSGAQAQSAVIEGRTAAALLDRADAQGADLIAVNALRTPSPLAALLTGSVARSLVVGAHQSVLLARADGAEYRIPEDVPVRAVLATDHSPYVNRCISLLGRFAPAGIEHLAVLSAYSQEGLRSLGPLVGRVAIDPAEAIREELSARNDTVIEVLSRHLTETTFSSHVVAGSVHEAIDDTLAETKADLLILGAKGHGFVERTLLGSVSFRQAVTAGRHSVLILRASTGS